MRFSDESAFATLQTLEGCRRVAQYVCICIQSAPLKIGVGVGSQGPYPLGSTFLPQALTYTDSHLKRARDIRRLWHATPSPPLRGLVAPLCHFSCLTFSSFPNKSTRRAHIWIMPVKWRRHCWAFILSGFDAPTSAPPRPAPTRLLPHTRTHLATSCSWLAGCDWRYDGFILNSCLAFSSVLPWIWLLPLWRPTLRVAVIKCAD